MVVPFAPPPSVILSFDASSYLTALLASSLTLLFTVPIALSNCPLLTASVALTAFATLVIVLLPALIPATVTLGPPAMVNPVLFITTALLPIEIPALLRTVSPAFTESTVKSLAVDTS